MWCRRKRSVFSCWTAGEEGRLSLESLHLRWSGCRNENKKKINKQSNHKRLAFLPLTATAVTCCPLVPCSQRGSVRTGPAAGSPGTDWALCTHLCAERVSVGHREQILMACVLKRHGKCGGASKTLILWGSTDRSGFSLCRQNWPM